MIKYLLLWLFTFNVHAMNCYFTVESHEGFESLEFIYIPIYQIDTSTELAVSLDMSSYNLTDIKVLKKDNKNIKPLQCPRLLILKHEVKIHTQLMRKLYFTDKVNQFMMAMSKASNIKLNNLVIVRDDETDIFVIKRKRKWK